MTAERIIVGLLDVSGLASSFVVNAKPMDCGVGWCVNLSISLGSNHFFFSSAKDNIRWREIAKLS